MSPGTIVLTGKLVSVEEKINDLLKEINNKLDLKFEVRTELSSNSLKIMSVKQDGYPIRIYSTGDSVLIIEGVIYNYDDQFIIENINKMNINVLKLLDGEYIILKISPNMILALTDCAASLPTYYYISKEGIIISRIPYILEALFGEDIDRYWLLTMLMYGYGFGEHTSMTAVGKLSPATLTTFKNQSINSYELWGNYETDLECNPAKIFSYLYHGTLNRVNYIYNYFKCREIFVDLTGGLDSRIALAIILKAVSENNLDLKIIANTKYAPWIPYEEIDIAKSVANILDIRHIIQKMPIKQPKIDTLSNLLSIPRIGPKYRVSGVAGDKTLKPLGHIKNEIPYAKYAAITQILNYANYPYRKIRALGIGKADIIIRHLMRWPEKGGFGIYTRYLITCRLANWLIGDKTVKWTISPYTSTQFLPITVRVDPRCKDYFKLCKIILEYCNPKLTKIKYFNFDVKVSGNINILPYKVLTCFYISSFKKIIKGQRASTLPTYLLTERMYSIMENVYDIIEYARNILGDKLYSNLLNDLYNNIEQCKFKTIAFYRARNILRLLTRLGYINLLKSKIS